MAGVHRAARAPRAPPWRRSVARRRRRHRLAALGADLPVPARAHRHAVVRRTDPRRGVRLVRASSSTSPCRPRRSRSACSPSSASSCCSPVRGGPSGRNKLDLLLTGQPRARASARLLGTLAVGGREPEAGTAFQARYSSVVFPVLVILVALGIVALPTRWLQAGARRPRERGRAGDDALGRARPAHPGGRGRRRPAPAGRRGSSSSCAPTSSAPRCCATRSRRVRLARYPRFTSPSIVDWIDYRRRARRRPRRPSPARRAQATNRSTSSGPSGGYGVHETCTDLLGRHRGSGRAQRRGRRAPPLLPVDEPARVRTLAVAPHTACPQ